MKTYHTVSAALASCNCDFTATIMDHSLAGPGSGPGGCITSISNSSTHCEWSEALHLVRLYFSHQINSAWKWCKLDQGDSSVTAWLSYYSADLGLWCYCFFFFFYFYLLLVARTTTWMTPNLVWRGIDLHLHPYSYSSIHFRIHYDSTYL